MIKLAIVSKIYYEQIEPSYYRILNYAAAYIVSHVVDEYE